jgi:hypothetical protein
VDDRRVLSGIIFVNRNGLRWRDAPLEYGPPKTLYNRWKRWSGMGVFARMMVLLHNLGCGRASPFPFGLGDARVLGPTEGREVVHQGDTGVDLGGLAVWIA